MDDRVNWTNAQAVRFWMSHYRSLHVGGVRRGLPAAGSRQRNRQSPASGVGPPLSGGLRAARGRARRKPSPTCKRRIECLGETAALNERIPTLGLLALARWRTTRDWPLPEMQYALELLDKIKRPLGYGSLEGYSALATVALEAWDTQRSTRVKHGGSDRQDASRKCLEVLRRYCRSFPIGEPRYEMHAGTTGASRAAPKWRDATIGGVRRQRFAWLCRGKGSAAKRRWHCWTRQPDRLLQHRDP